MKTKKNRKIPQMKSVLLVEFNNLASAYFEIEDVPIIPAQGEYIDFEWSDYIEDKEIIQELKDYDASGGMWRCDILIRKYFKNRLETRIVLMTEKHYEEHMASRYLRRQRLLPAYLRQK